MNALHSNAASISSAINPFPGLRSFDVWENYLFFGRDNQTDALLKKLSDHRFVSVVGTSGSGKSSLVRAGLLPELYGGFMVHAGSSWRVAMFRPGNNPIFNMAAALTSPEVFGQGDPSESATLAEITAATLESSSLGLVQVVRQARMGEGENLLIVVDQFEELFRFKENAAYANAANHAAAFVKLLLEAVHQKELPIYVVMTLRSDFLGDCAQYRDLPEAINEGQYLIPRLRREQHREAVVGPAAVGGGKMAPRLVQQLLNDVGDNPDQLPILQHALMRTWDYWTADHAEGEPVDLRHYEAIGGMAHALSQHADEAYNELPDDRSRAVCASLFKCLTERGPDNRGIRRPTRVREVCAVAEASAEEVIAIVERFRQQGRSFIMPPYMVPLTVDTVLDISHESLMRAWERLERWVAEDAQSSAMYRRLVESSALHENHQAGLWRDPELQEAVNWRETNHPNAAWGMRYDPHWDRSMAFLDASIRERAIERHEARRRRRVVNTLIAAFLLFACVLSIWALTERASATKNADAARLQQQLAEEQSQLAQEQRKIAQGQSLSALQNADLAEHQRVAAEQQKSEAEKQRKVAEQKSAEALAQKKRAEQLGAEAVASGARAETERRRAEMQRQKADSLRTLAEQSALGISRLRLLSISKSLAVKSLQIQRTAHDDLGPLLALQAYEFFKHNGGGGQEPDIYDALYGASRNYQDGRRDILSAHHDGVRSVCFTPDGQNILSADGNGTIALSKSGGESTQSTVLYKAPFVIRDFVISSTGHQFAFCGDNDAVHVLTVDNFTVTHDARIACRVRGNTALAFTPEGTHIAACGADGVIRMLNIASASVERTLQYSARLKCVTVSRTPDNRTVLAAGAADGSAVLWDLDDQTGTPIVVLHGSSAVDAVAFDRRGGSLAVGYDDGMVQIWNVAAPTTKPVQFIGPASPVFSLAYSDDGGKLASGCGNGQVRIWSVTNVNDAPVVIHDNVGWIWSVAFAPDGRTIAIASSDRTVRLVPTSSDDLASLLESKMKRSLTRKEWRDFVGVDVPFGKTEADTNVPHE